MDQNGEHLWHLALLDVTDIWRRGLIIGNGPRSWTRVMNVGQTMIPCAWPTGQIGLLFHFPRSVSRYGCGRKVRLLVIQML